MESSILSLLQEKDLPTDESKWKSLKVKHDVMSNKKDFPLVNAKLL